MLDVKIKVEGELVRMGLQNLAVEVPLIGRRQIYNVAIRIRSTMRRAYSTVRPTGSYRRTYNLYRGWNVTRERDGYSIWNDVRNTRGDPYGQYVVGDGEGGGQAWMHVGRWPLFREVVDTEVKSLPPDIEQQVTVVARAWGL